MTEKITMLLESGESFPLLPADDVHTRKVTKRKVLRYISVFLSVLKKLLMVVIFKEGTAADVAGKISSLGGENFYFLFCVFLCCLSFVTCGYIT